MNKIILLSNCIFVLIFHSCKKQEVINDKNFLKIYTEKIRVFAIDEKYYVDVIIKSDDSTEFNKLKSEYLNLNINLIEKYPSTYTNSINNNMIKRLKNDNYNINETSTTIEKPCLGSYKGFNFVIKNKNSYKSYSTYYLVSDNFSHKILHIMNDCLFYEVVNNSWHSGANPFYAYDYAYNGSSWVLISSDYCYKNISKMFSGTGLTLRRFETSPSFPQHSCYLTYYY